MKPAPTPEQLATEVGGGARLVVYQYAASAVILSQLFPTKPKLIRPGEGRVAPGLRYTLLSMTVGWWGFPWGPIYTVRAINRNLRGGIDVTAAYLDLYNRMSSGASSPPAQAVEQPALPFRPI